MQALVEQVVRDVIDTVTTGEGDEASTIVLWMPWGLPADQRAALLAEIGRVVQAVRGRGIWLEVMRVAGQQLTDHGLQDAGGLEAMFVLYAGDRPTLP